MITLQSGVGNYIQYKDSKYHYFAGNNYLGLANHPEIVKSVIQAIEKYGVNFSASRQTTGTSELHLELEKLLSDYKDQQDSIVFASGYMGNKLLINAMKDNYSTIFADSQAHPSILDGIPGEFTTVQFYNHCNADHLEDLLKQSRRHKPLIITDGIFALTGEIAPLDQIYHLAEKYDAILVVDDAHATGVLGKNGRGTPDHFNLNGATNIFQSETMSKALGGYGGFISAGKEFIHEIRSKSRFYGASTSLPPPIVAAGCASVRFMQQHPELRDKLKANAHYLRTGVMELGFSTTDEVTPIIPVFLNDAQSAKDLSIFLEQNKIIAPSMDYPVNTGKYIVRMTVSASHTKDQIENVLDVLKKWRSVTGKDFN